MIATLTPNPCLDLSMIVDDLVKDDAIRVREFKKYAGGKGICVSRVLRRLGENPVTLTCLGGHTGDEVQTLLDEEEIRTWYVEIRDETRTNLIIYERDGRTLTRLHMRGPKIEPLELEELNAFIRGLPDHIRYLCMGGSLLKGFPEGFYHDVAMQMMERGVRVALDADEKELKNGLEARPFLIKPNHFEIGRLVGKPVSGKEEAARAAREIVRQGVEIVVVSMGREGAVAVTEKEAVWAVAPPVETKSTVGSGDSMTAAIVRAHSAGERDLGALLAWGAAAGTATALTPGTELCYKADVERLFSEVTVERLEI